MQEWALLGDCPDFRVSENGTVPFGAVYRSDRSKSTKIGTVPLLVRLRCACQHPTLFSVNRWPKTWTCPLRPPENRISSVLRGLDGHCRFLYYVASTEAQPCSSNSTLLTAWQST